jgi:ABC-2 type transport system ATP-binding protein
MGKLLLIGRNGSGKSTLLKIIAGIYPPTSGTVRLSNPRLGTMIELGVGFHPELTGEENIYLGASIYGLSRKEVDKIYPEVVAFSELDSFMDTSIKNYSSGMQARLGFALAVNLDPDILLVDEILAVGDEAFQRKCMARMEQFRSTGKTIVFVSHSPEDVRKICDRACVLDFGSMVFLGKSGLDRSICMAPQRDTACRYFLVPAISRYLWPFFIVRPASGSVVLIAILVTARPLHSRRATIAAK